MEGARFQYLTQNDDVQLKHYRHVLSKLTCNPPCIECYFRQCKICKDSAEKLKDFLRNIFEDYVIDQIEYRKWTSTDRSTLETIIENTEDFVTTFGGQVERLLRHDFIAKIQMSFMQDLRDNHLKEGEFLVIGDFAENYTFIIQDEVQSFHWNNMQATLHPFVCYYKIEGKTEHLSFVIISECLIHDNIAVHLFQRHLINYLKKQFNKNLSKIFYFSDGCAGQYKNLKNFINLTHHQEDFGVDAEWHFFATSHGKGPCDGVGGAVKRLAAKASLQRVNNDYILTPYQLYNFVKDNMKSINAHYLTIQDWEEEGKYLKARYEMARTIPGTQQLPCFRPVSTIKLEVAYFSLSTHKREEIVTKKKDLSVQLDQIKGYVTVQYDGKWWLAMVLNSKWESREVEISFLHPHGPSPSFYFPDPIDKLVIDVDDILVNVNPITATGRTYNCNRSDIAKSTNRLHYWLRLQSM
ncbi:unnamed protein product [Rotaria socialis]|uniref:Uncharacterized protein n=1 Tax=Rotaria socialis TaxID=392032 RepID=A0A818VUM1_9BILA|nr:unnamed protein product [Rotaria socialis]